MKTSRTARAVAATLITLATIGGTALATTTPAGAATQVPTATTHDIRFGVKPIDNASAGHYYVDLTYTNITHHTVKIRGYAGVSLVAHHNGTQVGQPATWLTNRRPATVTLRPGQTTTEIITIAQAADFGPTKGHPVRADGFKVYLPGSRTATFVPYRTLASTRNVNQLQASPIGSRI